MRSLITVMLVTSVAAAAPPSGPLQTLKQKNGEVEKLLRQKPATGSPEEKKQKEDIKVLAASLLDYSELAKRSMATHWDTLKAPQREEFVTTFKQMLENNYVKNLKTNLEYQVQYKEEELAGDDATVPTLIKVKTKGKSTDAEIVYKLHKVGADGKWMVWDIITDEVSLLRNYKNQFHRIITEQGYDKLLEKMKSKLKEQT
jgi:phospholipid transport system substrate-binding protein